MSMRELTPTLECMCVLLLALSGHSHGQVLDPATIDDPCASQTPPPPGRRFSDNLSCPRIDGVLQCYNQSELCNGVGFCIGARDEGGALIELDCDGSISGTGVESFVCSPGVYIPTTAICDGVANCSDGDDETTTLCENKCLMPYAGGCAQLNRFCLSSEFDVNCLNCLPGFAPNPLDVQAPCVAVELELQTSNVREGDPPGSVPVCVELISGQISTEVEVLMISTGGTATDGLDYFTTISTLTFVIGTQPGEPSSRLCSSIVIADDQLVENTESFDVHVSSTVLLSAVHFPNGSYSSIFIFDNDQAIFRFTQPVYQQNENNSPLVAALELVSGILTIPATVQVQTEEIVGQPDVATEGIDYQPFNQNLTFSAGSSPGAQQHIMVPLFDDNDAENVESFNFQAIPQSSQIGFAPCGQQAVGQIIDDDVCQFGFEQSSSTVIEGPGNTTEEVCLVKLSTGTPFLIDAVTVEISTTIGTKTAGLDFLPLSTMITFLPGVTRHCVNLTLLDDDCVESLECIEIDATSGNTSALQVVPNLVPNQDFSEVCCTDDDTITVRLVPPSGSVMPEYTVNEGDGVLRVGVEVIGGQLKRTVTVVVNTHDGSPGPHSAQSYLDYFPVTNHPLRFNATSGRILFVPITVYDDLFCEGDETFFISLSTFDPAVMLDRTANNGTIKICDNDPNIDVGTVRSSLPSYSVREGDTLHIDIELVGRTGLGRDCILTVTTMDGSALSNRKWRDYFALPPTLLTFDSSNTLESVYINVCDDSKCEGDEEFEIRLSTSSPGCTIGTDPIPVTIIDDEIDTHGMGDDPHFSIALPSGELLCYTVQGEHGFSFNLISNKKMVMNAKFVPDARRPEVTWLGSIGIIVQHSNYKGSNDTKLRFDAHEKNIYIGDKVVLGAKNIEKLTFSNGKLTISEAPPSEGFHYPSVYVDLEDVQLQFTVKFTNQHLDIYWHTTGGRLADSHGLIGQFFRKGVEIDEVRKILIMPSKEPIPVMRRPVWSFMEREMPDDDQLCWTAMNPGYQGEGLIDGTYFDYLVDDVLSTDSKLISLLHT